MKSLPLVRERSRVQSSLAAPSFPNEINHDTALDADVPGINKRNVSETKNADPCEIRGLPHA